MTVTPYVVSADILGLLGSWAKRFGFVLPPLGFFSQLRFELWQQLASMFDAVELLEESELSAGLLDLVGKTSVCTVSLDRSYFRGDFSVELTRYVDTHYRDCGLRARWGTRPVVEQLAAIVGVDEVLLVDDVIFSGDLMERVARVLQARGVRVIGMCAGVGVGEGVQRLRQLGFQVSCVREYPSVIDEVCERDFYPGVPFSGRSLLGSTNVGLPYLLPFGVPERWASIPQSRAPGFSRFCIRQSIALFEAIGAASNRAVTTFDLDRRLMLPDGDLVDQLHRLL